MSFRDALRRGRAMLMDGAMGTELIRRGYAGPTPRANLDAPRLVAEIHADYVAAGAEAILANTFMLLSERDVDEIAAAAVRLAREARPTWTLASLGPTANGVNFPDLDRVQTCVRAMGEIDGLLLETCSDASALSAADATIEAFPVLPVLVSFAFAPGQTDRAVELAKLAERTGIAALGVNCGRDQSPVDIAQTLSAYRSATAKPLFARPNAGSPRIEGGAWIAPQSPAAWAAAVAPLLGQVALLGGCCGTTPKHIGELRRETTPN